MSYDITFVVSTDFKKTAHFFCEDCASELNVVLVPYVGYLHPRYSVDWDLPWHEFHNIKYVYPQLFKNIWDKQVDGHCPSCGCIDMNKIQPMDNWLFDIKALSRSFDADNQHACLRCESTFASHKCVIRTKHG